MRMKIESKKHQSADCDPYVLAQLIENYDQRDQYGYVLVEGHLVPYTFFGRLHDHISNNNFKYGDVISIEEICGREFLESLNDSERQVVEPCLLILIENGFALIFPD